MRCTILASGRVAPSTPLGRLFWVWTEVEIGICEYVDLRGVGFQLSNTNEVYLAGMGLDIEDATTTTPIEDLGVCLGGPFTCVAILVKEEKFENTAVDCCRAATEARLPRHHHP
ncbi:hypothetical protein ACH5RR_009306 [Cinchona calisaya]|uniref:Uncharacterized protein n=1 Tax=Cinchona calisaya TaxID=153742 RepID=A0ABD3AFL5_9GENT